MTTTSQPSSLNRSFLLGKLFSLLGLVPIGVYVIVHLYNNTVSLRGEEAFNQHVMATHTPFYVPLTILVIWIPIFFHGIYGLVLMKKSRPNLIKFPHWENLKFLFQRLSGIGLLLFIPAHIYKTRIEPTMSGHQLDFAHMVEGFSEPLTGIVYCLGILGAAYHLANGLWQAAIGWGFVTTQRGMNRVQVFCAFLFFVLLTLGYAAMWGFYRA